MDGTLFHPVTPVTPLHRTSSLLLNPFGVTPADGLADANCGVVTMPAEDAHDASKAFGVVVGLTFFRQAKKAACVGGWRPIIACSSATFWISGCWGRRD